MLPIGNRPILWHVMKLYATFGFGHFVLALGYLGDVIRQYFLHYEALASDYTIELGTPDSIEYFNGHPETGWRVTCVETGADALTGTRVLRAMRHVQAQRFMVTYGDGVGDIDIAAVVRFHRSHGRLATMTAVHPPGRFGELRIGDGGVIEAFEEKPQTSSGAINGGFMVFEREVLDRYIPVDADVMLEREPLAGLAADGELMAYQHDGFWQPMDTPREMDLLNDLWSSGKAPWKVWT
jgi:glucose-1-phosphate cytidylyltransferase